MDEPKVPKCTCLVGMRSIHRPNCVHALVGQRQDKPKPDVLERGKAYFDEHFTEEGPIPRELCSDVERLLADAIAEIKRLEKELVAITWGRDQVAGDWKNLAKEYEELEAQLRAITEAKPVEWVLYLQGYKVRTVDPTKDNWEQEFKFLKSQADYTLVPLYAHPPKGDTEE